MLIEQLGPSKLQPESREQLLRAITSADARLEAQQQELLVEHRRQLLLSEEQMKESHTWAMQQVRCHTPPANVHGCHPVPMPLSAVCTCDCADETSVCVAATASPPPAPRRVHRPRDLARQP